MGGQVTQSVTTERLATRRAGNAGGAVAPRAVLACDGRTRVGTPTPVVEGMPAELARSLANFDDLDFRVYTNQQWQDLHKSHTKDVVVHWPDGHETKGIERHIEDLKFMFSFAPDNRIREHPVRFGTADAQWAATAFPW